MEKNRYYLSTNINNFEEANKKKDHRMYELERDVNNLRNITQEK